MVDGCFILTDQEPSSTCHSVGMLRFEVLEDPEPLLKLMGRLYDTPFHDIVDILLNS